MEYASCLTRQSAIYPGVEFVIARMSLGRRIELGRRIRDLGLKGEFLAASTAVNDQLEAGLLEREIGRIYLEWGLVEVRGLRIDGQDASPQAVIALGPEDLATEITQAIRQELQLTGEERKN
jgi:hypothetical protein